MFFRSVVCYSALAISTSFAFGLQSPEGKQGLQTRVAELKEATAKNRAALQNYQWTEITTILLKGEVKKTEMSVCRYDADGVVHKSPVGESAAPQQSGRGGRIKASIVKKKASEMKDYSTRLKSLIGEYVPPNGEKIQDTFKAGNASIVPTEGLTSLTLSNYYKPGDKLTFSFDPSAKRIRGFNIDSYLDDPKNDVVTLTATYASLPDGSNYVAETDLIAKNKKMEIRTQNSNYQKLVP